MLPAPVWAQARCFSSIVPSIDSAATRNDSLALAERFLTQPPNGNKTCGRLVAGYIMAMASSPANDDQQLRLRAIELLNEGLRGNESDPRYSLAMSFVYYNRGTRVDGRRVLQRGEGRVENAVPPLTANETAAFHYIRGLIAQDEWRDFRVTGEFNPTAASGMACSSTDGAGVQGIQAVFFVCPVEFDAAAWTSYSEMRFDTFKDMVKDYEAALLLNPHHRGAIRGLLEEYLFLGDWESAYDIVRRMLKVNVDDPMLLAVSGAVLHTLGRDTDAERTFRRALDVMPAESRRVYDDITPLIRKSETKRFIAADSSLKTHVVTAFWNSIDPLYLTAYNERRLEHWSRVATVDLLFGVPTLGFSGWETDAGQIWIRYGRPQNIREVIDRTGLPVRQSFWTYTSTLRFTFTRAITFRRYRFTDDSQERSDELQELQPHRDWRLSTADTVFVLDRQIVRLRRLGGRPQVLFYTPWPPGFGPESRVGLTVMDAEYQPTLQWRGFRAGYAIGAEINMFDGTRSIAVEVWDAAHSRLATARDTVTSLPTSGLVLSDVLVARHIEPRDGRRPAALMDVEIEPVYGLTVPAGEPVSLYWEIYGLKPDSTDVARYDVTLSVRRGELSLPGRILRGITGRSEQATAIRYDGNAPLGPDGRVVEWLEFEGLDQPGEHRLVVTVRDRVTGAVATVERLLTVKQAAPARAGRQD